MPIYAYRCTSCGYAQDVLQKISDPLLTVCPSCSASSFEKQVTAAGFQLKGSGWYVTDFRGGSGPAKPAADGAEGKPADATVKQGAEGKAEAPAAGPAAAPAPGPAPAPAPAAASPAAATSSGSAGSSGTGS